MALQTKKGVPFSFLEMQLCEKFHCLPLDLARQPWDKMELFLEMMQIEQQFSEKDNRLAEKKHG